MALDLEIARLSKILVDSGDMTFDEAEAMLRSLKLEIVIGEGSASPAAHAAALTAASVGRRTFLGGVRVVGKTCQPLITALPLEAARLGEACAEIGAKGFDGPATFSIHIGGQAGDAESSVAAFWDGWVCGVRPAGNPRALGDSSNPLAGVGAGAMAVGYAFDAVRGGAAGPPVDISLWGTPDPPTFEEVFLPAAVWVVGLGNLGQAFAWALAALPYADADEVSLVLHDFDHVSEENWGTSVLVPDGVYGALKTKLVEQWLDGRGFAVRRVDRRLLATDRIVEGEPKLAFSGVDKNQARRDMTALGFEAIVDAGLGRTAADFDKIRLTVLHDDRRGDAYFGDRADPPPLEIPDSKAYRELAADDRCGAAQIAGASVAVPYVSAIAAAIGVARMIALVSGQPVIPSITRRTGATHTRPPVEAELRTYLGLRHAGRPAATSYRNRQC